MTRLYMVPEIIRRLAGIYNSKLRDIMNFLLQYVCGTVSN